MGDNPGQGLLREAGNGRPSNYEDLFAVWVLVNMGNGFRGQADFIGRPQASLLSDLIDKVI